METGLYSKNFSQAFKVILEKAGVSCYQVSKYSDLDQAYLSRLRNGEMSNPSPETLVKISVALARLSDKISLYDIEKLFNSVGRSLRVKA